MRLMVTGRRENLKSDFKHPKLWAMVKFFRKNVTFLTFLTIFSFSIHPGRIKSLLP